VHVPKAVSKLAIQDDIKSLYQGWQFQAMITEEGPNAMQQLTQWSAHISDKEHTNKQGCKQRRFGRFPPVKFVFNSHFNV